MAASNFERAAEALLRKLKVPEPTSLEFMIAVMVISLQDLKRAMKKLQRDRGEVFPEDED